MILYGTYYYIDTCLFVFTVVYMTWEVIACWQVSRNRRFWEVIISSSFWRRWLQACILLVLMEVQGCCGQLSHWEQTVTSTLEWYLSVLALLSMNCLKFALIHAWAIDLQADVSLREGDGYNLRRLCKRREGWQWNFLFGCMIHVSRLAFATPEDNHSLVLFPVWMAESMLLRNAGVTACCLIPLYRGCHAISNGNWSRALSQHFFDVGLLLHGGTAETARDTRLLTGLATFLDIVFEQGYFWLDDIAEGAHLVKVIWPTFMYFVMHVVGRYGKMGRRMKDFKSTIKFLKFRAVRSRRRKDNRFVLRRQQDMPSEFFGNPTHAYSIVSVSHAWLSPQHADPNGMHLDIVISRLEEIFDEGGRLWTLWRWWARYYYLEAEGDVLFFFDMSSLPQQPRNEEEQKGFQLALKFMNCLYSLFPVMVVPDIPKEVKFHGHHITYLEKGWCWAEATSARLGGQLGGLSRGIKEELDRELGLLLGNDMSLVEALNGSGGCPAELQAPGQEAQRMTHRKGQDVPMKIFTNGKADHDIVAHILRTRERQNQLRVRLAAGEVDAVAECFQEDDTFFDPIESNFSRQELANAPLDKNLGTPLHLAVAAGSVEVVEYLVRIGAKPSRDAHGRLPWEHFWFPRLSAAAVASRRLSAPLPHKRSEKSSMYDASGVGLVNFVLPTSSDLRSSGLSPAPSFSANV